MTVKELHKIVKQLKENRAPNDIVCVRVILDNEFVYLSLNGIETAINEVYLEASDDNR